MCRNDSSAKTSDICEQAYSPSSIRALFEGFRSQAENSLLFLKSVTKLSVHVKAAGSQSPQLVFQAAASPQVLSLIVSLGWLSNLRPSNQIPEPAHGRIHMHCLQSLYTATIRLCFSEGLQISVHVPLLMLAAQHPITSFHAHF